MHKGAVREPGYAEIQLDKIEQRFEIASFLAVFPSILFVVSGYFFIFLIAPALLIILSLLLNGILNLPLEAVNVIRGFFFICVVSIIWCRAIARSSPITLFLFGTIFALIPLVQAGTVIDIVANNRRLQSPEKVILLLPCLLLIYFAFRLVLDSWLLARTPKNLRKLLMAVRPGPGAFRQLMLRVLGIHQLSQWVPQFSRRSIAKAFFVLRSCTLALALFIVLSMFVSVDVYFEIAASPLCIYHSWLGRAHDELERTCISALGSSFMLVFVVVLFFISGLWLFLARRVIRLSLEQLIRVDPRPPVLFLRSFKDDQVALARPKRPFLRRLFGLGEPSPKLDHVLVEEATQCGRVVAIGLPGAPAPFGAARTYVNDNEWQLAVADLARAASAIAIVADDTEGVIWELSLIRREGLTDKTVYLLPPNLAPPKEARRIITREVMNGSVSGIRTEGLSASLARLQRPCIAWLQSTTGELTIFTTRRPSSTSYVCALRIALSQLHSGEVGTLNIAKVSQAAE